MLGDLPEDDAPYQECTEAPRQDGTELINQNLSIVIVCDYNPQSIRQRRFPKSEEGFPAVVRPGIVRCGGRARRRGARTASAVRGHARVGPDRADKRSASGSGPIDSDGRSPGRGPRRDGVSSHPTVSPHRGRGESQTISDCDSHSPPDSRGPSRNRSGSETSERPSHIRVQDGRTRSGRASGWPLWNRLGFSRSRRRVRRTGGSQASSKTHSAASTQSGNGSPRGSARSARPDHVARRGCDRGIM
jgi:hypothetical protein